MPRDTYAGWITPERAAERAKVWRDTLPPDKAAEYIEIDRLLTMKPVRASATAADDAGVDDEFASLWPPRTTAEDEARARADANAHAVKAAALDDDDDLYRAIFGEG